ncbi:AI-2E family transporter [Candidatus Woesearchaeota archaeon]|nr:AI-2E family transporter [Candidatus Woesearchaeota archaeon]
MRDHKLKQSRIVYLVVLAVLVLLSLWVIKPFILTMIGAVILGYIFYPVYKWVLKKIGNKWASAFIVSVLIILIFTIPFIFAVQTFTKEAYVSYLLIKQKLASGNIYGECAGQELSCRVNNWMKTIVPESQLNFYLSDVANRATQFVLDKTKEIIVSLPNIFLHLFILLFVMFYTFKDGKLFIRKVEQMLPVKENHKKAIFSKTKEMLGSTIYGIIVVAFVQGIIAGIGYFIFGVRSPVILGIMTALAALVPIIGTAIVWLPTSLVMIFEGLTKNQNSLVFNGIGLLIYGALLVSLIDNFLRPKIIGDRAKLHPVLVLIGILGGIAAFGIVGVLIGPLVLALLFTVIEIMQMDSYEA